MYSRGMMLVNVNITGIPPSLSAVNWFQENRAPSETALSEAHYSGGHLCSNGIRSECLIRDLTSKYLHNILNHFLEVLLVFIRLPQKPENHILLV
jgi:hypothetical protein